MAGQTSAHLRAHQLPDSGDPEIFWRIANPIMAGLIGFYWAHSTGAFVGAGLAVVLPFVPAVLQRLSPVLRGVGRWIAPHLQTAWGRLLAYLPLSLLRVIEQRRS